jgi:two-component system response regulator DegU
VPDLSGLIAAVETKAPSALVIDTRFGQVNDGRGTTVGTEGLQAVVWVRGRYTWLPVVVIARPPTEREMFETMRLGCSAYLSRSSSEQGVVNAVIDASTCRFTFSSAMISRQIVGVMVRRQTPTQSGHVSPEVRETTLTTRELDVLGLVSRGRSNKLIANELQVSDQTVKNYVTAILRKLQVTDRTQAVVQAMRLGWIAP